VIIAQGGRFGGWSVYAKNGKAKFVYNVLGIQEFMIEFSMLIPGGHTSPHGVAYDGGGLAKGGNVTCITTAQRSVRAVLQRPNR
jgi:hypothetical protein